MIKAILSTLTLKRVIVGGVMSGGLGLAAMNANNYQTDQQAADETADFSEVESDDSMVFAQEDGNDSSLLFADEASPVEVHTNQAIESTDQDNEEETNEETDQTETEEENETEPSNNETAPESSEPALAQGSSENSVSEQSTSETGGAGNNTPSPESVTPATNTPTSNSSEQDAGGASSNSSSSNNEEERAEEARREEEARRQAEAEAKAKAEEAARIAAEKAAEERRDNIRLTVNTLYRNGQSVGSRRGGQAWNYSGHVDGLSYTTSSGQEVKVRAIEPIIVMEDGMGLDGQNRQRLLDGNDGPVVVRSMGEGLYEVIRLIKD